MPRRSLLARRRGMTGRFAGLPFLAAVSGLLLSHLACRDDIAYRQSQTDPVAKFIRTRMQPAAAAFAVPDPLWRDDTVTAVLEIAPSSVTPEKLQDELQRELGGSSKTVAQSSAIKIASRMVAELKSGP